MLDPLPGHVVRLTRLDYFRAELSGAGNVVVLFENNEGWWPIQVEDRAGEPVACTHQNGATAISPDTLKKTYEIHSERIAEDLRRFASLRDGDVESNLVYFKYADITPENWVFPLVQWMVSRAWLARVAREAANRLEPSGKYRNVGGRWYHFLPVAANTTFRVNRFD